MSGLPAGPKTDLTGKRFGRLVVLEYVRPEHGEGKWRCRCDCGAITYKKTGHLNAGTAISCGCAGRNGTPDLTGKRFGKLTVLRKTEQMSRSRSTLWECRCDCGNPCLKPANQLSAGTARSCGCAWRQPSVHTGDRFGRLTALKPKEERSGKSVVWECLCDCGKTVSVRATSLADGHTTSCGCAKQELDAEKDFRKLLTYTDHTCIEFLEKISEPTRSTSPATGVRGVSLTKDGRYLAKLRFRGEHYYLGRHKTLEAAVRARKQAEVMVAEYLDDYYAEHEIPVQGAGDKEDQGL